MPFSSGTLMLAVYDLGIAGGDAAARATKSTQETTHAVKKVQEGMLCVLLGPEVKLKVLQRARAARQPGALRLFFLAKRQLEGFN